MSEETIPADPAPGLAETIDPRPLVLVVDDEAPVRSALCRCLRRLPCRLVEAASVEEALEVLEHEDVDLLLTDLCMPGASGQELLEAARELSPETVRILLTAHGDVSSGLRMLEASTVYRYLAKPWRDGELRETIRQGLVYGALVRDNERLRREWEEVG